MSHKPVKLLAFLLTLLAICTSCVYGQASGQWVDVIQGQTSINGIWQGAAPVPGVNIPATSSVYQWNYSIGANGQPDTSPGDYSVVKGALTYTPPAVVNPGPAPPVAPGPNAAGMEAAIIADTNISNPTKLVLIPYFAALVQSQTNAPLIQSLWASLSTATGTPMTAAEISLIQAYGNIYDVPLVATQSMKGIRHGAKLTAVRRGPQGARPGRQIARIPGRP